jgi:hypothetical protein
LPPLSSRSHYAAHGNTASLAATNRVDMLYRLLNPEAQLLTACLTPNEQARFKDALSPAIDWHALSLILDREGAAIHVWKAVEPHAASIPAAHAVRLRALARVTHFRMAHLEQRTRDAVATLHDRGIDCVLLKGAALAAAVYGSFTERPMRDVDILVRPTEVERAKAALLQSGWVSSMESPNAPSRTDTHHIPPLIDSHSLGLVLELHRALLTEGHPFQLDIDQLFHHTEALTNSFRGARVFTPTYMLLHACIHFAYIHMFRQGAWRTFRDIDRIIALESFSWPAFVNECQRVRAASCAYWVLHLASQLANVPVPTSVMQQLMPPMSSRTRTLLARHLVLILTPGEQDCPSIGLRRVLWSSAIRPRWSGHGSARPWELFSGPIGVTATARGTEEEKAALPSSPQRTRAWSRYLKNVIVGR